MLRKKYDNGTLAFAHSLGEDTPGEYLCEIQGVSLDSLKEDHVAYIVHWFDKPKIVGEWSCSLVNEGYLRPANFSEKEFQEHLEKHMYGDLDVVELVVEDKTDKNRVDNLLRQKIKQSKGEYDVPLFGQKNAT